jgi:hypothetical protein
MIGGEELNIKENLSIKKGHMEDNYNIMED